VSLLQFSGCGGLVVTAMARSLDMLQVNVSGIWMGNGLSYCSRKSRISDSDVDKERGESEDVEMAADTKNQSEEVDAQMEEEDERGNETTNKNLSPEPQSRPEPDLPLSRTRCRQRGLKIYSLLRKKVGFLRSYSPTY
jgi:hypothetical protein